MYNLGSSLLDSEGQCSGGFQERYVNRKHDMGLPNFLHTPKVAKRDGLQEERDIHSHS